MINFIKFFTVSNWRALNLFQLSLGMKGSRDVSVEGYSEAAQVKLRSRWRPLCQLSLLFSTILKFPHLTHHFEQKFDIIGKRCIKNGVEFRNIRISGFATRKIYELFNFLYNILCRIRKTWVYIQIWALNP